MRRSDANLASIVTAAALAFFCGGCFPSTGSGGGGGSGGGAVPFSAPTLEVTVSGVHFGPSAPDSGSAGSLVTQRDATTGVVSDATLHINGSLTADGVGCNFVFDTFGSPLGVGQYTISSQVQGTTPSGIVYPTGTERVQTPEGGAGCSGSACDGGALVITSVDAAHIYGYVQATVMADSGAGLADIVCTFWLPMSQYQP
jgi:hypothetical protein